MCFAQTKAKQKEEEGSSNWLMLTLVIALPGLSICWLGCRFAQHLLHKCPSCFYKILNFHIPLLPIKYLISIKSLCWGQLSMKMSSPAEHVELIT